MADTMKFDLVAPERRLASGQATAARLPGAAGDMTAMPDHAPTIATLRPGVVSVDMEGKTREFAVTGGFVEITPEGTTVLAEEALPTSEVTADFLQERIRKAEDAKAGQEGARLDSLTKLIADLVAMGDQIGIATQSRAAAP